MSNSTATPITAEKKNSNSDVKTNMNGDAKTNMNADAKKNVIDNHKKAAVHHEAAAKNHNDAAKFREEGDDEKAEESTVKAHGHHALANQHQRQAVKNSSCKC